MSCCVISCAGLIIAICAAVSGGVSVGYGLPASEDLPFPFDGGHAIAGTCDVGDPGTVGAVGEAGAKGGDVATGVGESGASVLIVNLTACGGC
eukprot:9488561-Pyramimonas_sp.AAC.1